MSMTNGRFWGKTDLRETDEYNVKGGVLII